MSYKSLMLAAGLGGQGASHVAIIMDGSGRWATRRGLPRNAGHRAGVDAVRRVVEAAPDAGVGTLTLHAFSSDNWQRSTDETTSLMRIFNDYLRTDVGSWGRQGIRVKVIGRRDRLPDWLRETIEAAEQATAGGRRLHLRLAIDYSARDAIVQAASRFPAAAEATKEAFTRLLEEVIHGNAEVPEVDLLIRTGGEQRLSDFFLWECAYAELFFTPRLWPDFSAADLEAALNEFRSRERRFGRIPDTVSV